MSLMEKGDGQSRSSQVDQIVALVFRLSYQDTYPVMPGPAFPCENCPVPKVIALFSVYSMSCTFDHALYILISPVNTFSLVLAKEGKHTWRAPVLLQFGPRGICLGDMWSFPIVTDTSSTNYQPYVCGNMTPLLDSVFSL